MLSLMGQSVFLMLLLGSSTSPIMWAWVPLFGLCMGAFGVLSQLIVQESFGIRHFGGIMGLINMASVVSFACGPLLAGASYDATGGYHVAFITVAVMFVVAVLLLSRTGRPMPRGQPSHRPT